jgi:hypothetical protein
VHGVCGVVCVCVCVCVCACVHERARAELNEWQERATERMCAYVLTMRLEIREHMKKLQTYASEEDGAHRGWRW